MESRRFLRLLAEARRRYGGFIFNDTATTESPPAAPADDGRRAPSPLTPCEEPNT